MRMLLLRGYGAGRLVGANLEMNPRTGGDTR
jgi:hypothetical protein